MQDCAKLDKEFYNLLFRLGAIAGKLDVLRSDLACLRSEFEVQAKLLSESAGEASTDP